MTESRSHEVRALSAADGGAWEARWMAEMASSASGARIVRRCVDVVDLLAVAAAGHGQAALVSSRLRRLNVDALDRLAASGVAVVVVIEDDDPGAAARVRDLGIRHVVSADAAAEVAASVMRVALIESDQAHGDESNRSFALSTTPVSVERSEPPALPAPAAQRRGAVIAVWGPAGGPGRTTVAVNVADEIAAAGAESLLIDADVYGGTAAVLLGLLDESPGIVAAARQASGGRLDPVALATHCWQLEPRMRVLTGLPRADRWPELRPASIAPMLSAARALADFTIVDLGFSLETDEELSFDTLAPRRNGATLAVLDEADVILVVGAGDVVGMHRLVHAMAELRDSGIAAPAWIVLNRVRSSVARAGAGAQLVDALERFCGQPAAAMLPSDATTCDGAAMAGRSLRAIAPRSPLRLAIADLAGALTGAPPATAEAGRRAPGRGLDRRRASRRSRNR